MGGLGPGGLDSDWIPLSERDSYLTPIECQTTGTQTSNFQVHSGKTNIAMENEPGLKMYFLLEKDGKGGFLLTNIFQRG